MFEGARPGRSRATVCVLLLWGCGGDSDLASAETGPDREASTTLTGLAAHASVASDATAADSGSATGTTGTTSTTTGTTTSNTTTDLDDTTDVHDDCVLLEDFEGVANGSPWPGGWHEAGGVALADVQDGRGRLRPIITDYSLARMIAPMDCTDVDASLTFMFTDGNTQGVGLFARNNGGYLRQTEPPGEGLAAFAEAFRSPVGIGLWREVDGQERLIPPVTPFDIQPNVEYRMRFRLTQQDASTSLLQTKIWPISGSEPADWIAEQTDDTVSLQNAGGALALDAWSSEQASGNDAADLFFDDIVVTAAR